MKRFLLVLFAALLTLVAILLGRALTLDSRQITATPAPPLRLDRDAALRRFSRAVQFQTVSYSEDAKPTEHEAFIAWLAEAYPRVHAAMRREVIAGRSLLFTWPGSDASLAPLLLMGHYDVVPVEEGAPWEHGPFSGAIADGYVWGRGTLDDKLTVIALLEAAEDLLANGHRPKRTILFAFGHDEEIGGKQGAATIARTLQQRRVKLDAVIDEGGAILIGTLPGITKPVALIGIAEKGFASIELSSRGAGGHSSMPPPRTEVGVIARAVDRVQSNPFPADVRGATAESFRWLAPEMPLADRVVLTNLWLLEPLLIATAKQSNSLNAGVRTTTAPTVISGGVKDNVIPSHARAVINFRILPGDSVKDVEAHVRKAIDDEHVQLRVHDPAEPSPVSDPNTPQFRALHEAIESVFPVAVVSPYLVVGATDARYYRSLTPNVYRFMPAVVHDADLKRVHGANERISVASYFEAIRFYRTLIERYPSRP